MEWYPADAPESTDPTDTVDVVSGPELTPLGKRIEMLRIERRLSKQHLARHVGTSRQQLWRVMTGKSELTSSLKIRLADAFGVPADALSELAAWPADPAEPGELQLSLAPVLGDPAGQGALHEWLRSTEAVERAVRAIPGGPAGSRIRRRLLDAVEDAAVDAGVRLPGSLFDLRRRVVNDEL